MNIQSLRRNQRTYHCYHKVTVHKPTGSYYTSHRNRCNLCNSPHPSIRYTDKMVISRQHNYRDYCKYQTNTILMTYRITPQSDLQYIHKYVNINYLNTNNCTVRDHHNSFKRIAQRLCHMIRQTNHTFDTNARSINYHRDILIHHLTLNIFHVKNNIQFHINQQRCMIPRNNRLRIRCTWILKSLIHIHRLL